MLHRDSIAGRIAARRPRAARVVASAAAALLAACTVGPDYVRPEIAAPAAYKESGPWKDAQPRTLDANLAWWSTFHDAKLDALIDEAGRANQNLRQAEAQFRQALAVAAQARASLWPVLGANAGVTRSRTDTTVVREGNTFSAGLAATWTPDLWGGVRRSVESGDAAAQASGDDLANVRLGIQSLLAQDYLQLRVTDVLIDLYASTVVAYTRALQLTKSQYAVGVALRSDVALAESQLATAQAAGVDLESTRAQLEHAIAILTGKPPALLALSRETLSMDDLQARLPVIPTGIPSDLLERRPDVAAAERRVAAANASIGVARAAYYPSLTLSASGGFNGSALAGLFGTPDRVWSVGAALAETIFDGGARRARSDQAVAAYDGSVAVYKQTVLTGFQQVEDNLAALRVYAREGALLDDAVKAAALAERSVLAQYRAGTVNYLSVVTAQTLSLGNQRSAVQLAGRRLVASVNLIVATGGGWTVADAPTLASAAPASASHD